MIYKVIVQHNAHNDLLRDSAILIYTDYSKVSVNK